MADIKNKADLFSLDDHVIIISGGYGYLGKAISLGLVAYGAKVYVLARSEEKFERTFDSKTSSSLYFLQGDISDVKSVKDAFEKVYRKESKIDALINNAFYGKGGGALNTEDDNFLAMLDGTLNSVYRCSREVIPYFLKQGQGNIINVSSMYGLVSPEFSLYNEYPQFLNPPHYGAAKAGVVQLTRYLAAYLGEHGIRVNCVSPGAFPSENVQQTRGFIDALSKKTSLKRIGLPKELQGAFVYLASKASSYVTGHNLVVDGGWTIT